MAQINEEKYRQLLMRQIGEKMHSFAYVDKENVRSLYNSVYETFAGGSNGSTATLESIRRHKKDHSQYPTYGYFDLDTLYAFHRFVDNIVKDIATYLHFHNNINTDDFHKCLQNNIKKFIENSKSSKVAWYNAKNPITIAKNKSGFAPIKTMTPSQYLKNYSKSNESIRDLDTRLFDELDEILEKRHERDGMPPKAAKEEVETPVEVKEFLGVKFRLLENSGVYTLNQPFTMVMLKKFYNNDYGIINVFYDFSERDIYEIKNEDYRLLEGAGNALKIRVEHPIAYYPNQNGRKNELFTLKFESEYGKDSICPPCSYSTLSSTRLEKTSNSSNDNEKFGKPTNNGEQIHFF